MKYLIALFVAVLFIAGFYLTFRDTVPSADKEDVEASAEVYISDIYGFSFAIPEGLTFHEYTQESIAIGDPTDDGGFNSSVEVRLYGAGSDAGFASYEEFIEETIRNMCAADGPSETIYCTDVMLREAFTSDENMQGEEISFKRIYENLATQDIREDTFGPLFIFNISANVPHAAFAALVVQPPVSVSYSDANENVVRAVASSVDITAVGDGWETSQQNGIVFQYPDALPTFYTEAVDWPPQVELLPQPYACTEAGDITDRAGATAERIIDSMSYCVTEIVEGAAGSIYTQYAFVFEKEGKTAALTFSTRSVQCGNFDEVQRVSCELERNTADIGEIVHEIVRTLQFP